MDISATASNNGFLRFLRFPLTRLVLLIVMVFYLYISGHLFRAQNAHTPVMSAVIVLWMILITLALYAAFVRHVEQRPVHELSFPGMGREFGTCLLMGFSLFVLCILVLMILGVYKIEGLNAWEMLLGTVWMGLSSGFFEELLFRGILFRITEEYLGSWIAMVVSALAFGLIHLQNPGATFQGVMFIAIGAGILFAACYMLTGRLWLSMGFHMAWNYTQSSVLPGLGAGNPSEYGLVKSVVKGPDILTGGQYGIEFSIVGLSALTITAIILLVKAVRKGRVVKPFWMREGG